MSTDQINTCEPQQQALRKTINEIIIDQEKRLLQLKKLQELEDVAKPMVEFLKKYYNPHAKAIVDCGSVEIVVGDMATPLL